MAAADYRLCDICNCKTFYDSNLDYDWNNYNKTTGLSRTGDWAVICEDCATTHEVIIQEKK